MWEFYRQYSHITHYMYLKYLRNKLCPVLKELQLSGDLNLGINFKLSFIAYWDQEKKTILNQDVLNSCFGSHCVYLPLSPSWRQFMIKTNISLDDLNKLRSKKDPHPRMYLLLNVAFERFSYYSLLAFKSWAKFYWK